MAPASIPAKPVDGIGAITFLGAEALRVNDDDIVFGHALTGKPLQTGQDIRSQRNASHVEARRFNSQPQSTPSTATICRSEVPMVYLRAAVYSGEL